MGKSFKAIVVFIFILGLSILLTPVFYKILPMFKFEKIFNRLVMVFTIAAAVIYVYLEQKKNGLGRNFWNVYGFDFSAPWKKLFIYGFLAGTLSLAFIVLFEVIFGPRYFRHPILIQDILERFFKGMLSGLIVAIVEEFFFRGFVFRWLKGKTPIVIAILLASAFYAATHFLDNGQTFVPDHPTVKDAARLLVGYVEPFTHHWQTIFPEFMGLFLFGITLCLAYLGTNSLFMPMGIHAGVVFAIKFQHSFVRKGPEGLTHHFFGGLPDYDGIFEWAVLIVLSVAVWYVVIPYLKRSAVISKKSF